ncbi:MAG: hypothetical protein WC749_02500 [Dehalococcoidia bacterium]
MYELVSKAQRRNKGEVGRVENILKKTCIDLGCPFLHATADAAGGGTYRCRKTSLLKGEWGHWTSETDRPMPYDDCGAVSE